MASQSASAQPVAASNSNRAGASTPRARSNFSDALLYAFDGAYRAPESLSLAQRSAYGLREGASAARRAQLGESCAAAPVDQKGRPLHIVANGTCRVQFGEIYAAAPNDHKDRPLQIIANGARRTQLRENCAAELVDCEGRPFEKVSNVAHQAQIGDDRSVRLPYLRIEARVDGTAVVAAVVVNGRAFAGARPWTR